MNLKKFLEIIKDKRYVSIRFTDEDEAYEAIWTDFTNEILEKSKIVNINCKDGRLYVLVESLMD